MPVNYHHITLPDYEFEVLREIINKKSGIWLTDNDRKILEYKLQKRLFDLGFNSFREYVIFLKYNRRKKEELDTLINIVTTNETYFFREKFQLDAFSEEILPLIVDKKKKSSLNMINIWSAGCSSGEEPYTIAMLILEKCKYHYLCNNGKIVFNIFANDINYEMLAKAREGIYSTSSFRATPRKYIEKYFVRMEDGKYKIKEEVKELVTFSHLNLLDSEKIRLLPFFDVVFCRNVLIYFDMESRKKLVDNLYDRLLPGGFLLLGHSESLINITTKFKLVNLKNDIVYQKPEK